jgi:hypothetical protein
VKEGQLAGDPRTVMTTTTANGGEAASIEEPLGERRLSDI